MQSLFGVHAIPYDNQIRLLLDAVPPQTLEPLYEELLQCLMSEGVIQPPAQWVRSDQHG